jgi:hypothetical protein
MAWVAAPQNKLMPTATARERSLFTHSSYGSLRTFCAPDVLEFSILTVRTSFCRAKFTVEESFHKFVGQSKTRVNIAIRFLNGCTDSVSSA